MALLAGRATPTTVIALDMTGDADLNHVVFGLLDVERGYPLLTTRGTPGKRDSRLVGPNLLVLQRIQRVEFADWTLTEFDVKTGTSRVRMTVTAGKNDLLTLGDFTQEPEPDGGTRWRIYLPETGEIWESLPGAPRSRLFASIETNLSDVFWLDSGERLLTMGLNGISTVTLKNAEGISTPLADAASGFPMLSADRRWMFLETFRARAANAPLAVYDLERLVPHADYSGYAPMWCGRRFSYLSIDAAGTTTAHLTDPATGRDEPVALTGAPPELGDMFSSTLDPACDWMLFRGAVGGRNWLLHRASGAFVPLGISGRVVDTSADSLMVQAQSGEMLQLRHITLDGAQIETQLLGEYRSLGANITYISGYWRGVFLSVDTLTLVDMVQGSQRGLAGPGVRSFFILD